MSKLTIPFLFVLASGFAGLVYQVTWQKYLSIFLGSHALATALVLAVFFCSLSAGYLVIGRWAHLFKHKFALYGLIEGLIGVYCLVSPNIFDGLNFISQHLALSHPALNMLQNLGFAFAFIGGPTFLMGGSIPVLTQALSSQFEASHKVHSFVYGLNTLGAFLGTLMAGFFFLEWWGLPNTLILTSFINIGVGAGCYVVYKINPQLYRGLEPEIQPETQLEPAIQTNQLKHDLPHLNTTNCNLTKTPVPASFEKGVLSTRASTAEASPLHAAALGEGDSSSPHNSSLHTAALLLLSFLSGFYVFSFETLIIRISGLSLGSSAYTYTIIVASFIAAIAVGSFMVAKFKARPRLALIAILQACMFAAMLATYFMLPLWPEWMMRVRFIFQSSLINFNPFWFTVLAVQLALLIVPIGLLGMNLPLLFHFLKNQKTHLAHTVGSIYALNSLGSAVGALVGGYFLFYWFSLAEVYKISLIAMLCAMPLVLYLYAQKSRPWRQAFLYAVFLMALVGSLSLPSWKNENFSPGRFHYTQAPTKQSFDTWLQRVDKARSRLLFYKDDPNTSVSVSESKSGDRAILVNGKPDSSSHGDHETRALAPLLALSIAPRIENIFIAGLGAGLSLAVAHQFEEVQKITVAEIAQGVVEALPYFDKWNNNLSQHPNKKYHIVVDDAYKVLQNKRKQFDVVIIEPSNPWVTGVEKLYSIEFYKQVSQALTQGGVFAQWFPTFSMEDKTLLTIFNNFNAVFKYVSIWKAGGPSALTIVASHQPLRPSLEQIKSRYNEALFSTYKLNTDTTLLGNQYLPELSTQALTEKHRRLHTLTHPVLAYEAGKNRFLNFSTHIDAVSRQFLTRPVLSTNEQDQFYYERLGLHKDKDFLQASLKYWSSRPSSSHTRGRLKFFLAHLDPQHKLIQAPPERVNTYMYLSGYSDKVPPVAQPLVAQPLVAQPPAAKPPAAKLDKEPDFLQQLHHHVGIYFRLVHWRLPAKLARLQALFPEAKKSCLQYKPDSQHLPEDVAPKAPHRVAQQTTKTNNLQKASHQQSLTQSSSTPVLVEPVAAEPVATKPVAVEEMTVKSVARSVAAKSAAVETEEQTQLKRRQQEAKFKACNKMVDLLLQKK